MGFYDEFEVNRVVHVELNPDAKQAQLEAAIAPVADRLLKQFKAAQAEFNAATANKETKAAAAAKDQMDALILFRADMGTFHRLYAFLSQIFDYGNTDIEKRSIFFKRLIPLLKFGRERDGVDLSSVVLTHHNLKNQGKQRLKLPGADYPTLGPITEAGSGQVREKQKAYLAEIIEKVNDLFKGELTDNDKLVYVNNVILGKLLESKILIQQALNNSKEQFANSPDLDDSLMNAIMEALDAHNLMSSQALSSEAIRKGLKSILLGPAKLYESLRDQIQT
jgi:type I restriction enzyme R subunit